MNDFEPRLLLEWFRERGEKQADRRALWVPVEAGYRTITWEEWLHDVLRAAAALHERGVRPGDRVAQLSENRYEWLVADLALQCVRAIHVSLHATQSVRQIGRELAHSGARATLVSTAAQWTRLRQAVEDLAELRAAGPMPTWSYEPCGEATGDETVAVEDWWKACRAADVETGRRLLHETLQTLRPDDAVKILYTSGTTGESKGVVLTQRNLAFNAGRIASAYGDRAHERKLCFLALSHVFAQTNDFYSTLVAGCELGLARSRDTVFDDCRFVQPTFLNGVPSFYQRAVRHLRQVGRSQEPGALRELFGGRLELCNAGGAPLADDVHEFYYSQGVPILQGYGLTETSPVISVSTPTADRRGCVGRPLADVQVRIAEDGEVLTRGPHLFAGYYRDERSTAEAIRDGWFHTGDLGSLDAEGFLRITGRKKELIVLANGRKVAPLAIEAALTADPLFHQAIVFGDGATHLVALVHLDPVESEVVRRQDESASSDVRCEGRRLPTAPATESVGGEEAAFLARVAARIAAVLADRAPWEQVRSFAVLREPLSQESGELTAKHSLRRAEIGRRHAELIRRLYAVRQVVDSSRSLPTFVSN